MQDLTAKRTLVKSPPELWEEVSEVERLAKHLGAFGEIKITKLDPEHTVAWEGEHASGTVSIEPSGWGTKVILTAELAPRDDPPDLAEAEEAEAEAPVAEAPGAAAGAEAPAAEAAEAETPVAEAEAPAAEAGEAVVELAEADDEAREADAVRSEPVVEPPRRRRRGFWSRLFASWLVPEERLNRPASTPPPPNPEPPTADAPGDDASVSAEEAPIVEPASPDGVESAEGTPVLEVEPDDLDSPEEVPSTDEPGPMDHERARSVLEETLDHLGSAHHRPFSRG